MKSWAKIIFVICAVIIFYVAASPGIAAAQNKGGTKPSNGDYSLCRDENLIGNYYKMVLFTETPERGESAWIHNIPYHYLAFFPDRYYSYLASDKEITTPAKLEELLQWPRKSSHLMLYTLGSKGDLNLYNGKVINYRYRCFVIKADSGVYKKGDLILTGYNREAKSELYKIYRLWYKRG